MIKHPFLFEPNVWIGEGQISFNTSPDSITFYTKWVIVSHDDQIVSSQEVEMKGVPGKVENKYVITNITPEAFDITLINDLLGTLAGKGVIDTKNVAWEFRGEPDFEGYEVYELQENGEYTFHAEYSSTEQFRTIIEGRIWKKL